MKRSNVSLCLAFSFALIFSLAGCSQSLAQGSEQTLGSTSYKPVSQLFLRTPIPTIMGRENEFYSRLQQRLLTVDKSFNDDSYLFLYSPKDGQGVRARVIFKSSRSDKELQKTAKAVAEQMLKVARDMGITAPARSLNLSSKVLHSQESTIWMGIVKSNTEVTIQETDQIN